MREIKFRAWNKYEYYYEKALRLLNIFSGKLYVHNYMEELNDISEEYILEQYTGLKDKNGKEICDGDIFQIAMNKKYVVRYVGDVEEHNHELYGACFVLDNQKGLFFPFDEFAIENGEIIGNIHENSELLEEK